MNSHGFGHLRRLLQLLLMLVSILAANIVQERLQKGFPLVEKVLQRVKFVQIVALDCLFQLCLLAFPAFSDGGTNKVGNPIEQLEDVFALLSIPGRFEKDVVFGFSQPSGVVSPRSRLKVLQRLKGFKAGREYVLQLFSIGSDRYALKDALAADSFRDRQLPASF